MAQAIGAAGREGDVPSAGPPLPRPGAARAVRQGGQVQPPGGRDREWPFCRGAASSDNPAYDPDGSKLQAIMQAAADYREGIILDSHTLNITFPWGGGSGEDDQWLGLRTPGGRGLTWAASNSAAGGAGPVAARGVLYWLRKGAQGCPGNGQARSCWSWRELSSRRAC